jgi:hypothetical protein
MAGLIQRHRQEGLEVDRWAHFNHRTCPLTATTTTAATATTSVVITVAVPVPFSADVTIAIVVAVAVAIQSSSSHRQSPFGLVRSLRSKEIESTEGWRRDEGFRNCRQIRGEW